MIKKTVCFSNPVYLSKKDMQIKMDFPEKENSIHNPALERKSIPIEDLGVIVLEDQQITLTNGLLASLLENNCAVITCDSTHMPSGLFLPLETNSLQSKRFREQIDASKPLLKQLWQQTISVKIRNQGRLLEREGKNNKNMIIWSEKVKSGDSSNLEGRAAAYYWKNVFPAEFDFIRDRNGLPPNNLLNYGYAILRAVVARGLVSSGLLPVLGIHHQSQYNAYCLADDIMEPYRPFVDTIVLGIIKNGEDFEELSPSVKKQLLGIPAMTVSINGEKSPLMVAVSRTTASLVKCYSGEIRKILYPDFNVQE